MAEHSQMIGGSTAKRVINCPGSWNLAKTVPALPSSTYADEGTMLHTAMAMILDGEVDTPDGVIGLRHGDHRLTPALFDEMIEPALEALAEIGLTKLNAESTVEIPGLPGEFGTADVTGCNQAFSAIVDFKFGRGVYVPVEENEQLMYYAVGARAKFPELFGKKPIRLYIIQPAFRANELPYYEITHKDLDAFLLVLKKTTRVMKKKSAPFRMGEWCRWCPADPVCPLKLQISMEALKKDGPLKPAELGRWLKEDAPRLEELIASRRKLAYQQLEAGHPVPGMKLVTGRQGDRKWADEEDVEKRLRGMRLRVMDFMNMKLKSPTQIEGVLKKLKKKTLDDLGAEITRNPGTIKLVTDEAEGDAVAPLADTFKKIAQRAGALK